MPAPRRPAQEIKATACPRTRFMTSWGQVEPAITPVRRLSSLNFLKLCGGGPGQGRAGQGSNAHAQGAVGTGADSRARPRGRIGTGQMPASGASPAKPGRARSLWQRQLSNEHLQHGGTAGKHVADTSQQHLLEPHFPSRLHTGLAAQRGQPPAASHPPVRRTVGTPYRLVQRSAATASRVVCGLKDSAGNTMAAPLHGTREKVKRSRGGGR